MTSEGEPVPSLATARRSAGAGRIWRLVPALAAMLVAAQSPLIGASPAHALEVSALPGQRSITLPVGNGRLIRFDQPVDSVFIAEPAIADLKVVAPDVVYVFGAKLGTTNLIAISADKRIQASIRFRVVMDTITPNAALRDLSPTTDIHISFDGKRATIEGQAQNVQEALDAAEVAKSYSPEGQTPINKVEIKGSQQVNIRVRFAEMSRNDMEAFGINWNVMAGNFSLGLAGNGAGVEGGRTLSAGFESNSFNAEVLIDALRANGVMKILAEPNLTAVTGQSASFLAGGEIPIPVPQDGDGVAIQYKKFGVSLDFTPTVLGGDRIGLRVRPEVSALSASGAIKYEGFQVPALTVRRADTTVEVASGQTFAIAGLFQRNLSQDVQKFPVLGDLPVLGSLFTSTRYRRDETELVILITPYLVQPFDSRKAVTPLDEPVQPIEVNTPAEPIAPLPKAEPEPTKVSSPPSRSRGARPVYAPQRSGFILK